MGSDSISVEIYLINCCYAEITKATEQKDNYQVNLVSICKTSDSQVIQMCYLSPNSLLLKDTEEHLMWYKMVFCTLEVMADGCPSRSMFLMEFSSS